MMFKPGPQGFLVVHPDTSPHYDPRFFPMLSSLFHYFMDAWNMPLFFFLAGISAYLSLQRRSVKEYRLERVHRLVVPSLFLCVCSLLFAIIYFAPMNSACLQHFYGNA